MSESNRCRHEQLLADALRQEAIDYRPGFSASLHVRLRDAVRSVEGGRRVGQGREGLVGLRKPGPASDRSPTAIPICSSHPTHVRPLHRALAAAAAMALLAAIFAWQWIGHPRVQAPPGDPRIADAQGPLAAPGDAEADFQQASELAYQAVEDLDGLVDAALAAQSWAELDEDARAALSALADHLPQDLVSALALSEPPEM